MMIVNYFTIYLPIDEQIFGQIGLIVGNFHECIENFATI